MKVNKLKSKKEKASINKEPLLPKDPFEDSWTANQLLDEVLSFVKDVENMEASKKMPIYFLIKTALQNFSAKHLINANFNKAMFTKNISLLENEVPMSLQNLKVALIENMGQNENLSAIYEACLNLQKNLKNYLPTLANYHLSVEKSNIQNPPSLISAYEMYCKKENKKMNDIIYVDDDEENMQSIKTL